MPTLDTMIDDKQMLLRVLAYGPAKAKKTWFAGTAAEAGFNVLMLNGDDGHHILKNIRRDAQKRIRIINCFDKLSSPQMGAVAVRMLRGDRVLWDDTDNKMIKLPVEGHGHFILDTSKLTPRDVLLIDSWTALQWSIKWNSAMQKNVDLSDDSDNKPDWEVYGDSGRLLDWCLAQISGLNCHVIVIGHSEIYEKYKKDSKGKQTAEIEFSRTQPISSSRAHAMKLAKYFSDVLYFQMIGNQYYIDTGARADRDSGSRNVEPKNWKWEELSFGKLCELANATLPAADAPVEMPAAAYYAPGEEVPSLYATAAAAAKPTASVANAGSAPALQASTALQMKPTGLAGLLKR